MGEVDLFVGVDDDSEDGTCPTGSSERIPSRLLVGCWALGESDVIAASALLPLKVAELKPFRLEHSKALVIDGDPTCAEHPDCPGPTCETPEGHAAPNPFATVCDLPAGPDGATTNVLGSCYGGHCRARCFKDSDCAAVAATLSYAEKFECDHRGGDPSGLGRCLPTIP